MEQDKKRDLIALIDYYRLVREDIVMFGILKAYMSTCQKLELSGKIKVLLS